MVQHLISKAQQQQIDWRRDRVLELSSQGFSQSDISTALQVDRSIISRDVAYLRRQSHALLAHHIHETIPEEYEKSMNSLRQVLRLTWAIVSKTPDEKTRLQALTLITECNKYKMDLATSGTIVSEALKSLQSRMDHLNGNGNGNGKANTEMNADIKQLESTEERNNKTSNTVF
jgi:hypothetical protein